MKIEEIAIEKIEKELRKVREQVQFFWSNSHRLEEMVPDGASDEMRDLQLEMYKKTIKLSEHLGNVSETIDALKELYTRK